MNITVLDMFEKTCQLYGEKVAFKDINTEYTFDESMNLAKRIASKILKLSKMKNKPIVVFIDRNVESIISFLGVVYSGNFYAPIDINQPNERIERIINKLDPVMLINATDISNKNIFENKSNPKLIKFNELISSEIDDYALRITRNRMIDIDPLYAMFTSGSTGTPKGVLIKHSSVIDLATRFKEEFNFNENNVFGNQAPFDFDVSVKDIYSTIYNGGTLIIIPKVCFMFPAKLITYVNENNINTGIWATSVLRIVENMKGLNKTKFNSLKTIMFSGEVMPIKVLNYWRDNQPEILFVNLYGPTEITCNCTYYKVEKSFGENETLPIGSAFKNSEVFLLDNSNKVIETPNIQGEICVRGTSLALGYYNDLDISSKVFVQNPLNDFYEEKIYRTGDLGKYDQDFLLIFDGRKDHQIKHMGHRIELAEIENSVNNIEFINAAVCVYDEIREKIVLFYESGNEDNKKVYLQLKELLPKYMIPNEMIWYEKLPQTKNAKIDRVYLKENHCGHK